MTRPNVSQIASHRRADAPLAATAEWVPCAPAQNRSGA